MNKLLLNGEEKTVTSPRSLAALLDELGYQAAYVAVEVDGKVVPRAAFDRFLVDDASRVEVVIFVGGG